MVPNSSSPGPDSRPLSQETAGVLREAVRRTVSQPAPAGPSSDEQSLRAAVAVVVAEARERQMRPEELLTAFKSLLDAIPEVHGAGGRLEEARLRERLVTLCIKAYYGS